MNRHLWTDIIGIVVLISVVAIGFLLFESDHHENLPGNVLVQENRDPLINSESKNPSTETYLGIIFTRESVDLAPKAQGILEDVSVQIGQPVKEGTVVAVLESESIHQQIIVAEASLRAAVAEQQKSKALLAEASERRMRREHKEQFFSKEEIDDAILAEKIAIAQLEVTKARVVREEAQITLLKKQLDDSVVKAPFAGKIATRYRDAGSIVGPGIPILRLISTDELWVRFAVPERQASQLKVGSKIRILLENTDKKAYGFIKNISPEVDSSSGLIVMEASLNIHKSELASCKSGTIVVVKAIELP